MFILVKNHLPESLGKNLLQKITSMTSMNVDAKFVELPERSVTKNH